MNWAMSPTDVWSVLLATVLAYFLYHFYFHPLAGIPGPLSARFGIPWFRFHSTFTRSFSWRQYRMHQKYGPVVRLGPSFVSVTDLEAVHAIYAHGSPFHKAEFYSSFAAIKTAPSIFADTNPESHTARRRTIAPVYSMTRLAELEPFVDATVDKLLERIDREIAHSASETNSAAAPLLVTECMSFFAADAVGELAFGETFGFLSSGDPGNFLPSARNLTIFGSIAASVPQLSPVLKRILWRTSNLSPAILGRESVKRVHARYDAIRAGNFYDANGVPSRRDMLTGFIEAKDSRTKQGLSEGEVLSQCATILSAGSESTAVSLDAFFYYVLRDARVYKQLMAELEDAVHDGRISAFPVSYAEGMKLEYFQACLKEAMRLLPAVGMEMPRKVPSDGILVGGRYFLPQGTDIGASSCSFHRSKEAFGEDAADFRPERWIGMTAKERAALEKNNLVFGAGNSVCIGRAISSMEMTKVLPTLFWKYTFSILPRGATSPHARAIGRGFDGTESSLEPWWLNSNWFMEVSDFWCEVKARQP